MDIDEQLPTWNEVASNALYAMEDVRNHLDAAEGFLDYGWRPDSPSGPGRGMPTDRSFGHSSSGCGD